MRFLIFLFVFLISRPFYAQEAVRYGLAPLNALSGRQSPYTAADPFGGYWLADHTTEADLPVTAGAMQRNRVLEHCPPPRPFSDPCPDVYLTHVDASGDLDYATYIGSSQADAIVGMQVDSKGNAILLIQSVYVTGIRPTLAALPQVAGTAAYVSVMKFAGDGRGLVFSRYAGSFDRPLALDSSDNVYLTGRLPDRQLAKLRPDGSTEYIKPIAPTDVFVGQMAVSASGDVYVAGATTSAAATQSLASAIFYNALPGSLPDEIVFVGRVPLGGDGLDRVAALGSRTGLVPVSLISARNGDVLIAGELLSDGLASTPGASGTPRLGESDAFLMRLSPDLEDARFRIAVGGEAEDRSLVVHEAPNGNLMVVGSTTSQLFPRSEGAVEQCAAEMLFNAFTYFLIEALADGTEIVYSSYLPQAQAITPFPLPDGRLAFAYFFNTKGFGAYGLPDFGFPTEGPNGSYAVIDASDAPPRALLCAVNGASFARNGVSPESLLTLFGSDFGPAEGLAAEPPIGEAYPITLGGVTVTLNGKPSSLIFVNHRQINLVVPRDATFPMDIAVLSPGGTQTIRVSPGPVTSGVFAMFGEREAAVFNDDGSRNRSDNPADVGSVIQIYATGLGPTNPPAPDDRRVADYAYPLAIPATVTLDGKGAEILSATRSPYAPPGVAELRVKVPEGISGAVSLSLGLNTEFPNRLHIYVR